MIFLAESGEEGAPEFGAQFMIDNHLDAIDAEFCLAEGGGVVRTGGEIVQPTSARPRRSPARSSSSRAARRVTARCRRRTTPSPLVGGGRQDCRVGAAAADQRDDGRLLPEAGDARAAGRGARYRDVLNPDPKCRTRRPSGCSRTSRNTGRCCTPRWCRRSSTAAIATTSFPPRRRRRSMSACIPTRIRRRFSIGAQGDQRSQRRSALVSAIAIARPALRA